jgi:C4-dicarboxylate-specific signal transduction histidine kinase
MPEHSAPATSMKPHLLLRYGFAIALVLLALVLSAVLQTSFGNPVWFFFPAAVILSAWFGGRGPGWLAVCSSTLVVLYYFIPPIRSFALKSHDVPFFLLFVVCELAANRAISWRREIEDSLRQAHNELEIRVEERTAELKDANDALLKQMEERKRTEEALQITRDELARVARITTIGELTASIAHEVNQPLAAVVANADACVAWLGLQTPNLVEARAAADRSVQGATRASDVIKRIRSLISKEAPQRGPVQINEVVQEAVALGELQAVRHGVSVELELAPDLPEILGDKIQLQQVILNLMRNGIESMTAIDYRPRRLIICSREQQVGQILVSIQDSGIGVDADVMDRLFEPFFTTRSQGIGMGLPISRSIIEAHGGRLWAESTAGQGSFFQFTLPTADGSHA